MGSSGIATLCVGLVLILTMATIASHKTTRDVSTRRRCVWLVPSWRGFKKFCRRFLCNDKAFACMTICEHKMDKEIGTMSWLTGWLGLVPSIMIDLCQLPAWVKHQL